MGLLDGKQIRDTSTSLDKLNGSGLVTFTASATMSFASGTFLRRETSDILVGNDVVNKEYVDAVAVGLNPKEAARVIYIGDVTAEFGYTYSNGVSGVGATLSFSFSSIDGINSASFSAGDRIVVNSTTDRWVNGIYDYTTTNLLTRSIDFDGDPSAEVDGGEYCFIKEGNTYADQGWVVSSPDTTAIIGTTPIVWVQFTSLGGAFNLSVADYNTGMTYSNVENIIFRGGVITKPASPGTASAVLVTQDTPVTVTVWIPQPDYVAYFAPSLNTAATSRYIADPTSNTYNSTPGNTGSYATGTWVPSTDFTGSTTRPVVGNATSTISSAFSEAEFACYDLSTTLQFQLFDDVGTEIRGMTISLTGTGTFNSSPSGLSINVSSFLPDSDRYKAAASGSINLSTIFPNGGKYVGWKVTHYNSGFGPGAGSPLVPGEYTFSTLTGYFFDNDLTPSSAGLNGTTTFDELSATVVYYSGVAFYNLGSTFALTASTVDLLNDITFPSTPQIDFVTVGMASPTTLSGHSDGTKGGYSAITGWSLNWDKSGLTYSRTATVTTAGSYIPNFTNSVTTTAPTGTSSNDISTTAASYVTSRVYDWALVTSQNSSAKKMLFDTTSPSTPTYNNNLIDGEIGRLSATGVISSGSSTFSSVSALPNDELQYIWGRVVYPNRDYTSFLPYINSTLSVNYSNLSGASKNFTIYTSIGTPTTTTKTFTDHRWFVTSYTKGGGTFANGIFTLHSNFSETQLTYDGVANNGSGTGDLEILVGLDDTSANTTPNKFLWLTGDYNTTESPGRSGASTYNLNSSTLASKNIQFDKGFVGGTVTKVWLFIGYKNTSVGRGLWVTNIGLA
jgi:hypothetical protein